MTRHTEALEFSERIESAPAYANPIFVRGKVAGGLDVEDRELVDYCAKLVRQRLATIADGKREQARYSARLAPALLKSAHSIRVFGPAPNLLAYFVCDHETPVTVAVPE
jgi:hypothetical protein